MKTNTGHTLNKHFRKAQRQADWLRKLHTNCGPKLNRIAHLAVLDKASLQAPKDGQNRPIKLHYVGPNDTAGQDKAYMRIRKVFELDDASALVSGPAVVKFKRIKLEVQLVMPQAA